MTMRLGCDPEVFMMNMNKELVSVIGKVDGNKWNPLQVASLPKGFTLQQDNVSLEFGIPPAASREEFVHYIQTVKAAGLEHLKGLSFSRASCAVFPEAEMQTAEAHVFGCEPDYNAWTRRKNPSPKPPHPLMRSAGGHVHIETTLPKREVVKAMDLYACLVSLFRDPHGVARRQMYGKPGAYRPKPYGVEYRSLSNFWIFSKPLISWVWDSSAKALEFVEKGGTVSVDVKHAIENNDKQAAKRLLQYYGVSA